MATKRDSVWQPFYDVLAAFYEELLDDDGEMPDAIYESKTYFHNPPNADKKYRAVLRVKDIDTLREQLEHVAQAFYASYKAANSDKKDYDRDVIPKLPIYVPRVIDDENIFRLQIHENKAHSSTNYKKDEMIPVISILKRDFSQENDYSEDKISVRELLDNTVQALADEGYSVDIEESNESSYVVVSINVARMCELYECDSIQLRAFTGRQIRANFFTKTDGKLERSKLQSVGVLLTDRHIEVVHSHERSIRTDAIYTAAHPDEIVLKTIPDVFRSGRLYKKYKSK